VLVGFGVRVARGVDVAVGTGVDTRLSMLLHARVANTTDPNTNAEISLRCAFMIPPAAVEKQAWASIAQDFPAPDIHAHSTQAAASRTENIRKINVKNRPWFDLPATLRV
jgi:hypothetical protein